MNKDELVQYVTQCCKLLNIKMEESDSKGVKHCRLFVPKDLQRDFNHEEVIEVVFDENDDSDFLYITSESVLVQKLANQILKLNNLKFSSIKKVYDLKKFEETLLESKKGLEIGKKEMKPIIENDIYVWYKTKIRSNFIEEYIQGFKFNLDTKELRKVKEGELNELMEDSEESTINNFKIDDFNVVEKIILKEVEEGAKEFIAIKEEEFSEKLETEINRIEDYYQIVKKEYEELNTEAAFSDYEVMINEKENLIKQQKEKYTFKLEDVSIETLFMVMVKKIYERKEYIIGNEEEVIADAKEIIKKNIE